MVVYHSSPPPLTFFFSFLSTKYTVPSNLWEQLFQQICRNSILCVPIEKKRQGRRSNIDPSLQLEPLFPQNCRNSILGVPIEKKTR